MVRLIFIFELCRVGCREASIFEQIEAKDFASRMEEAKREEEEAAVQLIDVREDAEM